MKKHLKLFKKDFLLQKKTILLTSILVVVLSFLNRTSAGNDSLINFGFSGSVFIITMTIITASLVNDDKNNVLMMLSGLPIKRKSLVANRYMFANIVSIGCSLLFSTTYFLIDILLDGHSLITNLHVSDAFFAIALVNFYFLSIYPLFFKFGYARTQTYSMIMMLVLMGIVLLLSNILPELPVTQQVAVEAIPKNAGMILSSILMVVSFIASYISYRIAVQLFKTREF